MTHRGRCVQVLVGEKKKNSHDSWSHHLTVSWTLFFQQDFHFQYCHPNLHFRTSTHLLSFLERDINPHYAATQSRKCMNTHQWHRSNWSIQCRVYIDLARCGCRLVVLILKMYVMWSPPRFYFGPRFLWLHLYFIWLTLVLSVPCLLVTSKVKHLTDCEKTNLWMPLNTHKPPKQHCRPSALPNCSVAPAGQRALPHCKDFSGTAWRAWKEAQSINLASKFPTSPYNQSSVELRLGPGTSALAVHALRSVDCLIRLPLIGHVLACPMDAQSDRDLRNLKG